MKLIEYVTTVLPMRFDEAKEVYPACLSNTPHHYLVNNAEYKACYRNIYLALDNLIDDVAARNSFYVLGYGTANGVPIEHAFININGTYYDPTWQKLGALGNEYVSVLELTLYDINTIIDNMQLSSPPDIHTVVKYGLVRMSGRF